VKFKVDENLPASIVSILAEKGHDVMSVLEQSLAGTSDKNLVTICQKEDRILVSFDKGFCDIRTYASGTHPGMIVLRLTNQATPNVESAVRKVVQLLEEEDPKGHLWIVEENRVRIRK